MAKRTFLFGGVAVVIIAGVVAVFWLRSGPDPSAFAYLTAPRLTHLDAQRMLVVEATGDPNVVTGGAIKLLFGTYFKANGVSRTQPPPAPRARWPRSLDTPGIEWVGRYAVPVGEQVTAVPAVSAPGGLRVSLETWEYRRCRGDRAHRALQQGRGRHHSPAEFRRPVRVPRDRRSRRGIHSRAGDDPGR